MDKFQLKIAWEKKNFKFEFYMKMRRRSSREEEEKSH